MVLRCGGPERSALRRGGPLGCAPRSYWPPACPGPLSAGEELQGPCRFSHPPARSSPGAHEARSRVYGAVGAKACRKAHPSRRQRPGHPRTGDPPTPRAATGSVRQPHAAAAGRGRRRVGVWGDGAGPRWVRRRGRGLRSGSGWRAGGSRRRGGRRWRWTAPDPPGDHPRRTRWQRRSWWLSRLLSPSRECPLPRTRPPRSQRGAGRGAAGTARAGPRPGGGRARRRSCLQVQPGRPPRPCPIPATPLRPPADVPPAQGYPAPNPRGGRTTLPGADDRTPAAGRPGRLSARCSPSSQDRRPRLTL